MQTNKLINLNLAAGRFPGLYDFIASKAAETDIFCFQELFTFIKSVPKNDADEDVNIYRRICEILGNGFSNKVAVRTNEPYMNGIFWKNFNFSRTHVSAHLLDSGEEGNSINLMEACLDYGETGFAECMMYNTHGFWQKGTKGDCSETIQQSEFFLDKIREYEHWKNYAIFCGDFNLMPDTKSIKMIETAGLRNLVTEYNVPTTRTIHCKRPEKFADYIFVGNKIRVHDFKVLPDEVSDHAPLYLEFSLD